MNRQEMTAKIAEGRGFIAALDQSGGSTPKALRGYGVEDGEWDGEEEMFAKIHEMRCRIVESPSFTGERVLGAILFERTMEGCNAEGMPIPERLSGKGIVPFLKVDKGMHDTENGAQLMKPMPNLE
ncbi:MAG: class I fructose-bisphosphate aldolase, partial [Erythrobacter sp.]